MQEIKVYLGLIDATPGSQFGDIKWASSVDHVPVSPQLFNNVK